MSDKIPAGHTSLATSGSAHLPGVLMEEYRFHQTVFNEDRRRKRLFREAAERIIELEKAVADSLMHLNTNIDVDGNSMAESDAADCLNAVMPNVTNEFRCS